MQMGESVNAPFSAGQISLMRLRWLISSVLAVGLPGAYAVLVLWYFTAPSNPIMVLVSVTWTIILAGIPPIFVWKSRKQWSEPAPNHDFALRIIAWLAASVVCLLGLGFSGLGRVQSSHGNPEFLIAEIAFVMTWIALTLLLLRRVKPMEV